MRAEQAATEWNFGHFWQTCCFTKITPKAIPHNYICGTLREFCALILLRFFAIHQVLLQKTAPHQCAKFTRKFLLMNYAVLP